MKNLIIFLMFLNLLNLSNLSAGSKPLEFSRDTLIYDKFQGYGVEYLVLKSLKDSKVKKDIVTLKNSKYVKVLDTLDGVIYVTFIKVSLIPR